MLSTEWIATRQSKAGSPSLTTADDHREIAPSCGNGREETLVGLAKIAVAARTFLQELSLNLFRLLNDGLQSAACVIEFAAGERGFS